MEQQHTGQRRGDVGLISSFVTRKFTRAVTERYCPTWGFKKARKSGLKGGKLFTYLQTWVVTRRALVGK